MLITKDYIEELMLRPLDLDTDLTDFIGVAAKWGACNDALEDLDNTRTLRGCVDDDARGDYIAWFYAEASRHYGDLGRWRDAEPILKASPYSLENYMGRLPERIPELEQFLLEGKHLVQLVYYAIDREMIGGWEELEQLLLDHGKPNGYADGIRYSVLVIKRRWTALEARILANCGEYWRNEYLERLRFYGLYKECEGE